jgi:hypothetical protein
VRDAEIGMRRADRLVRVWLPDGEETWLLIHIEVQSQEEQGFARRMFIYYYRIFDNYEREVVSLAVLAAVLTDAWDKSGTHCWGISERRYYLYYQVTPFQPCQHLRRQRRGCRRDSPQPAQRAVRTSNPCRDTDSSTRHRRSSAGW